MRIIKQFGGKVTAQLEDRYAQSPHWKSGKFQNLVETTMDISIQTLPKLLYKQFCENNGRAPAQDLPLLPVDKDLLRLPTNQVKSIWYGHSAMLMRINDVTVLVDPMLGGNASPVAPFKTKRFSSGTLSILEELPAVDLVLMTHDHYDHLDFASISKLKKKVGRYFVALGVARHLISWGIDATSITEFDWWDTQVFRDISLTFTPTRHFSGRGLSDRAKSIWGGWVIKTEKENIYFSGDGGYGDHFKEIGKRLGPFDFGIMECGQYNEHWHAIHMFPEESIQAALDAGVSKAMAVHWGGFALAQHHWKDPIQRFTKAAIQRNLPLSTPPLGHAFTIGDDVRTEWWDTYE